MNRKVELTASERDSLKEVARSGMLQKIIPAKDRARLIEVGFIEQKLGRLVASAKGKLYLKRRR